MNCRQAENWMDAVLDAGALDEQAGADQALPVRSRAEFDAHLAQCPTCSRQWNLLRTAEAALRVPRPVQAPAGLLGEFRQRVAQEAATSAPAAKPHREDRPWLRWLWPMGSLAAATAALALVFNTSFHPASTVSRTPPGPQMARLPSESEAEVNAAKKVIRESGSPRSLPPLEDRMVAGAPPASPSPEFRSPVRRSMDSQVESSLGFQDGEAQRKAKSQDLLAKAQDPLAGGARLSTVPAPPAATPAPVVPSLAEADVPTERLKKQVDDRVGAEPLPEPWHESGPLP